MTLLNRLIDALMWLCLAAATAGMVAISALVALSAIMRYVVSAPFAFTEELVGLVLTAMLFLALPVALWRAKHIRMSLVSTRIKGAAGGVVALVAAAVLIAFSVWFLLEAWKTLGFEVRFNTRSTTAELLLYPWVALLPLSMALILLISAIRLPAWWGMGRRGVAEGGEGTD